MNRVLTTCGALALESPSATAVSARSCTVRDVTKAWVRGAGGGTDAITSRVMAKLEPELPVSFSVINETGGVAGSNGIVHVFNQPIDGDMLAGTSESSGTSAAQGGWGQRFDMWPPFRLRNSIGHCDLARADRDLDRFADTITSPDYGPADAQEDRTVMSYCVLVEFDLKPGAEEAFLPLMRAQAANSLKLEPGCRVFDVWTASDQPGKVLLYEVYADKSAFDLHLASDHFQRFDGSVTVLVNTKRVLLLDQRGDLSA